MNTTQPRSHYVASGKQVEFHLLLTYQMFVTFPQLLLSVASVVNPASLEYMVHL